MKEPRVASAGSLRRGPFLRTPTSRPGAGHGHQRGGSGIPVPVGAPNNGFHNGADVTAESQENAKQNSQPMYDENGVRLDRTPTDDEINWLWDKVRTCLNRESSTVSSNGDVARVVPDSRAASASRAVPDASTGQPSVQVAHKYIDGNSLASKFRVATRVSQNGNGHTGTNGKPSGNFTVVTPKKISMDHLGTYAQNRASLLNQRRQQQRKSFTSWGPAASQGVIHATANQYQAPSHSNGAPHMANGNAIYDGDGEYTGILSFYQ